MSEQLPHGNPAARFNSWFSVKVTNGVGTMWCAYAFAALAFVSPFSAISSHNADTLVSWVSQTFLQLVLLSVIIVGQNVLASAADKRAEATDNDADAVLHEVVKLQEHLAGSLRRGRRSTTRRPAHVTGWASRCSSAIRTRRHPSAAVIVQATTF